MKSADFEKEFETFHFTLKADADILFKLNHMERMFRFTLFL